MGTLQDAKLQDGADFERPSNSSFARHERGQKRRAVGYLTNLVTQFLHITFA